jgi:lincosamide nucleotidyltransferase
MLPQEQLIERIRTICREDARVNGAIMYGSFAYGEGDPYSDIEFLIFFENEAFPTLDRRAWLEQIAPVELMLVNDFGVTDVIFDNLIRGEFHFHSLSEIGVIHAWPAMGIRFPSLESILLVDKAGRLAPVLEPVIGPQPDWTADCERLQSLADNFINWCAFGFNVLHRGELARSLELLSIMQRHLLWLIRLSEGKTEHWFTPARGLEDDISHDAYTRFQGCTGMLDNESLEWAYYQAWTWGGELLDTLQTRCGIDSRASLRQKLTEHFKQHD